METPVCMQHKVPTIVPTTILPQWLLVISFVFPGETTTEKNDAGNCEQNCSINERGEYGKSGSGLEPPLLGVNVQKKARHCAPLLGVSSSYCG